jgi:tRNA 2-selenouridine synthase
MSTHALPEIDDLGALFVSDRPLLDVRAPVEFGAGAFPTAVNLPLVDDDERHRIGIEYAEQGQAAALTLGEDLVSGALRARRIGAWRDFVGRHPDAALYCFRGGLRSQISQRWLADVAGITCPRVRGGYKAMRRYLLGQLEACCGACNPVVVGGQTGVGKTRLLQACRPMVDLEALAHHRGSAFGAHAQPQPTQVDFENALAIALLKLSHAGHRDLVVEDESRNVGSRHVPPVLFERMEKAPLVLLEADIERRVEITLQEYVHDARAEFVHQFGAARGRDAWSDYLRGSLDRIRRRLGGDRHARARRLLDAALARQRASGDASAHRDWIRLLLTEYYDGMYAYQLERKRERIVFRGDHAAVLDYLQHHYAIEPVAPEPRGNLADRAQSAPA